PIEDHRPGLLEKERCCRAGRSRGSAEGYERSENDYLPRYSQQIELRGGGVWLVSCLADGLKHAHERGISHRDIKPANVLITDEGQPMLVDFNLADDIVQEEVFSTSRMGGTIPYMSPEQLTLFHKRSGKIDQRCDLYSLGILFYELLSLQFPFKEHNSATPL